jgi:exopolysaccharide biosynthesis polyprenyl glycosylphosphotransferase
MKLNGETQGPRSSTDLLRLGNDPYWLPLVLLAMADALVFAASIWLAYPIRFCAPVAHWFPLREGWSQPSFAGFFQFGLLAAAAGVITFERLGFYHSRIGTDRKVHVLRILAGVLIANLALQAILSIADTPLSRGARLIAFLLTGPLAALAHYLLKHAYGRMVHHGLGYQRTLLVIDDLKKVGAVVSGLAKGHGTEFNIAGVLYGRRGEEWRDSLADWPSQLPAPGGDLGDLRRTLASRRYDAVLIHLAEESVEEVRVVARHCEIFEIDFYVNPKLFERVLEEVPLGGDFLMPVLSLGETPLSGSSIVVKRLVDLAGSGLLILVCLPFWCLIAALIKIESKGPVFYHQERVGVDGRSFRILKFRSMRYDAEGGSGPVWATEDDPRRTRLGVWMRGWNIDETPQFINVFRGDMSLVGPRPERPYFVNQFKGSVPSYLRRHLVKSGITGWAQVNGLRGDTSIEERTRYDMWYIENWSFLLDLRILAKTLFVRENAY